MKNLIILLIMLCPIVASAQNDPQKMIDEFFTLYKNKSSDVALDYIFGSNKWMKESSEQIENVKFQINTTVVKAMGA